MGKNGSGRRSLRDLFAERQIHMRSGEESRYVVLSRRLQIGVAAGFLAILALLAIASYNAIAKHVALVAQERTLQEELALRAAQEHQAAGEMAALQQQIEAAEHDIQRLTTALDRAQAERMEAITASSEAGAKAAELEAALLATTQERRRLADELAQTLGSGGAPSAPAPAAPGSAELENLRAEVTGLRAELERVNREAEALRRTAGEARQALRDLGSDESRTQPQSEGSAAPPRQLALTAAPAGDEVHRLQQDLADAQAIVASLSADLEALKGAGSADALAIDAAAELAMLEQQLGSADRRAEQLGVSLAARQLPEISDPSPDAALDASSDAAPLPSPPAPR